MRKKRKLVLTRRFTALVALTLAVGACGSEPTDAASGGDPDTPVSSTPGEQPDVSPTAPVKDGAQRVEPKPGMAGVRAQQYERAEVVDEQLVRVFFYQGVPPCSVLDRVDVEYGTETIGLTLQVGHDPEGEGQACIELAVYNYVDVALDEPVKGRKIVDGAR